MDDSSTPAMSQASARYDVPGWRVWPSSRLAGVARWFYGMADMKNSLRWRRDEPLPAKQHVASLQGDSYEI